MRHAALMFLAVCACGSPVEKTGGSTTANNTSTNGTNGTNATNSNSNSNSNSINNVVVITTTGTTSSTTNVAGCEILTANSEGDYCNLQADCDGVPLLVECEGAETWTCYCADRVLELDSDPCLDAAAQAPLLAAECGLTD